MLAKELVAASTVPLVLAVLSHGESYGYELIRTVKEQSGGEIVWSEGMLYPVLHWMEREEMIESVWKETETGRRRKYYRLKERGRESLAQEREQWMTVHTTLSKLWQIQPNAI